MDCTGFSPKRLTGPLNKWCQLCNNYISQHLDIEKYDAILNSPRVNKLAETEFTRFGGYSPRVEQKQENVYAMTPEYDEQPIYPVSRRPANYQPSYTPNIYPVHSRQQTPLTPRRLAANAKNRRKSFESFTPRIDEDSPQSQPQPLYNYSTVSGARPEPQPKYQPNTAPVLSSRTLAGSNSPQRLLIFDFDKTLSSKQVGPFDTTTAKEVAERCFGGQGRVDMLKSLFNELAEHGNCQFWVVTRNSEYIVNKALKAIQLRHLFQGIIGNESFDLLTRKSKAIQDYVLNASNDNKVNGRSPRVNSLTAPVSSRSFNQSRIPMSKVLFIDDEPKECQDVTAQLGCYVHQVASTNVLLGGGMGPSDVEKIRKWCGL